MNCIMYMMFYVFYVKVGGRAADGKVAKSVASGAERGHIVIRSVTLWRMSLNYFVWLLWAAGCSVRRGSQKK